MLILLFFGIALGRIHELDLVKDDRAIIDLSSFAYNNNGTLSLTFKEFRLEEDEIKKMIKARDFFMVLEVISKSGRYPRTMPKVDGIGDQCQKWTV